MSITYLATSLISNLKSIDSDFSNVMFSRKIKYRTLNFNTESLLYSDKEYGYALTDREFSTRMFVIRW